MKLATDRRVTIDLWEDCRAEVECAPGDKHCLEDEAEFEACRLNSSATNEQCDQAAQHLMLLNPKAELVPFSQLLCAESCRPRKRNSGFREVWSGRYEICVQGFDLKQVYTKKDLSTCQRLNIPARCNSYEGEGCGEVFADFQKCLAEN